MIITHINIMCQYALFVKIFIPVMKREVSTVAVGAKTVAPVKKDIKEFSLLIIPRQIHRPRFAVTVFQDDDFRRVSRFAVQVVISVPV